MPLHVLDHRLWFPPVETSMEDGLLAMGGDLSPERLLLAYRQGIFPWFEGAVPLWWSPDPRCVIFPGELKISHSMKQLLKRDSFEFRTDEDFRQVVENCRQVKRKHEAGTWISDEIVNAYETLHQLGYAHCAAVYQEGELAGGLYGLKIGAVFCGESMFSRVSNASKYAFIKYVALLQQQGIALIDCQVPNPHLESLGARMIPRKDFIRYLNK